MAKNTEQAAEPVVRPGNINARIIDADKGLRVLSEVQAVRIRSTDYNLLIMEDYMPTLGKLDGDVVFLTPDGEVRLNGIHGFYKHQHNEFTLLVEEQPAAVSEAKA